MSSQPSSSDSVSPPQLRLLDILTSEDAASSTSVSLNMTGSGLREGRGLLDKTGKLLAASKAIVPDDHDTDRIGLIETQRILEDDHERLEHTKYFPRNIMPSNIIKVRKFRSETQSLYKDVKTSSHDVLRSSLHLYDPHPQQSLSEYNFSHSVSEILPTGEFKAESSTQPASNFTGKLQKLPGVDASCGGFADVWKCSLTDTNGKLVGEVGVKVMRTIPVLEQGNFDRINKDSLAQQNMHKIRKNLSRELRVWQSLSHPHILPLLGVGFGFNSFPALVSPWMANGDIGKMLGNRSLRVTLSKRLSLLSQAASGLQYLHEQQPSIIHGDLKANNILVDDRGCAYLADFGLSRWLGVDTSPASLTTNTGPVRWTAPEILNTAPRSCPTDIYAFGRLMLEVLTGCAPFHCLPNPQIWKVVTEGKSPICDGSCPTCASVGDSHRQCMENCWSTNPQSRPTAAALCVHLLELVRAAQDL